MVADPDPQNWVRRRSVQPATAASAAPKTYVERINISGVQYPLWHVSIVDYNTDACRGYALLAKGAREWHVVHNELEICF
jgi:hypothetical protein